MDDDLVAQLNGEQDVVKADIEDLRRMVAVHKEELEAIWRTENKMPYELTSVFVHRGSSPQFGHYFFYSRNLPDHPDVWFKYNDSTVTEVSKDEVFADTTGSTANPYLVSRPITSHRLRADVFDSLYMHAKVQRLSKLSTASTQKT